MQGVEGATTFDNVCHNSNDQNYFSATVDQASKKDGVIDFYQYTSGNIPMLVSEGL